jgi:hypothetical protein
MLLFVNSDAKTLSSSFGSLICRWLSHSLRTKVKDPSPKERAAVFIDVKGLKNPEMRFRISI